MEQICAVGTACREALILELAKGIPTALIALLIGLVVAGIAFRQYKVAAGKFNLDLFKERYEVYEAIFEYLKECHNIRYPAERMLKKPFLNAIPKAYFLFGPEVGAFMKEINTQVTNKDLADKDIDAYRPENSEWNIAQKKSVVVHAFFDTSLRDLHHRFGKYMDFKEWVGKPSFKEKMISFLRTEVRIRITY
ncbi:MAG: hypothetical protein ABIV07_04395 [Polaromonas sp.]